MENILNKKHYKSAFYLIVALILSLSLVARFFVLPHYDTSLEVGALQFFGLLLDGLVISLLISVFIGSFIFWLTPEIVKKSLMEVISPKEIGPFLLKAMSDTKNWIYKGSCGRYTRAVTLPQIAQSARKEGIGRDIRITVLDPENDILCTEYATYRRSLKSAGKAHEWSVNKVREEVIASIFTFLKYKHDEPLLRIEIFLTSYFSAFRLDISDNYVIVTKEDSEASGLKADKNTYFYDSYKDDVRLTERQSIKLIVVPSNIGTEKLTVNFLKDTILKANVISEEKYDQLDAENILSAINKPKDPYG